MAQPNTLARGITADGKVFDGTLKGSVIIDKHGRGHVVDDRSVAFNTGIVDANGTEIFVGDILSKASGKDEREYMVLSDDDYFFMTLHTRRSIEDNPEPQFEQYELTKRRARYYEIVTNCWHKLPEED